MSGCRWADDQRRLIVGGMHGPAGEISCRGSEVFALERSKVTALQRLPLHLVGLAIVVAFSPACTDSSYVEDETRAFFQKATASDELRELASMCHDYCRMKAWPIGRDIL